MKKTETSFVDIDINKIIPSKTNPRTKFEKIDELSQSIKNEGLIKPIIVRKLSNEIFEIVDGQRRYMAAVMADYKTLPCIIKDFSDDQIKEIQMIDHLMSEYIDPLDQAAGIFELSKKMDFDSIAVKLCKKKSFIFQRLKLLDLIPELQDSVRKGFITYSIVDIVCRQTKGDQLEIFNYLKCSTSMTCVSLVDLKNYIKNNFHLNLSSAPFKMNDETLFPEAGACTNCPKRSGFNPDLFDDIKSKFICLDPKCFHIKVINHIQTSRDANPELILLSTNYYVDPKLGFIGESNYRVVDKKSKNINKKIEQGIYVHGNNTLY